MLTFPLNVITIRSSRTYAMAPDSWHWLQSTTSLIKRLPVGWVSHDLTARWIVSPRLAVTRKWCTLTDAAVGWHSFMFSEMTVRRVEIPPALVVDLNASPEFDWTSWRPRSKSTCRYSQPTNATLIFATIFHKLHTRAHLCLFMPLF